MTANNLQDYHGTLVRLPNLEGYRAYFRFQFEVAPEVLDAEGRVIAPDFLPRAPLPTPRADTDAPRVSFYRCNSLDSVDERSHLPIHS